MSLLCASSWEKVWMSLLLTLLCCKYRAILWTFSLGEGVDVTALLSLGEGVDVTAFPLHHQQGCADGG